MVRRATRTTTRRPGLFTRLRARNHPVSNTTYTTTTTTTQRTKRNRNPFAARRRAPMATTGTHHNHGTTAGYGTTTGAPVHHHRRRPSIGDKISGAMMKLRGSLTRRPGLKAAGTRRMHGTDGRGSHRVY